MAYNWQSDSYKQAAAARGGSFSTANGETTNVTWNEAVDPSKWENGGHYVNPNTGSVQQWWADGSGGGSSSNNSIASSFSSNNNSGNSDSTQNISLAERPTINLADQYKSLYDSLGIQTYRDQMTDYTNQVNAMQEEMTGKINALRAETDEAAALINENPWNSAANRTGRLAKLENAYNKKAALVQNEYNTKLNSLQNEQSNLMNQYSMAMSDLSTQMGLYTQQYDYDLANFDYKLNQLNTLLDMGALDNASLESIQNLATQTGMSSDMIASMIQAQKNSRVNPTLLTNTDDYGNVHVTLMDANTGNIINQQTLQGVAQSNALKYAGSGSGSSGLSDVNSLLSTRKTMKDQGLDTTVIDSQLEMYGVTPSSSSSLSENEQNALDSARRLLKMNYASITGLQNPISFIDGTRNAALTEYNALMSNLSTAQLTLMKGSTSDKELANALKSIPLNTGLSNDDFKYNLGRIITKLEERENKSTNKQPSFYEKTYGDVVSSNPSYF